MSDLGLMIFKFQYDNTLRANILARRDSLSYLNSNMIIL